MTAGAGPGHLPLPPWPAQPLLAFLDVGMTEFLLIAGLFLLLFGADRVSDLARTVGQTSAKVRRTAGEFSKQLDAERGLLDDRPGDAVPRDQRERFVAHEQAVLARLRLAATDLGIDIEGKSEEELRADIARAVGSPEGRGR